MVASDLTNYPPYGVELFCNFPGGDIHHGMTKFCFYLFGIVEVSLWLEVARIAPPSTEIAESIRDSFLVGFVEILAKVGAGSHLPRNEIFMMHVKHAVNLVSWFSNVVPGFCQESPVFRGNGKV